MILISKPSRYYELMDSGEGMKLERFGDFTLARPDPQTLWNKSYPAFWEKADANFSEKWKKKKDFPESWTIKLHDLSFSLELGNFKHVGVFPEQIPNWQWMQNIINEGDEKISVLNLFGYTGGATLACIKAGAEVTHLDGSRKAIEIAKENLRLSNLNGNKVRWILDDAKKFVYREIKRGKKYNGVVLDPPIFGRGPKGEVWKIEEDLLPLILYTQRLISEKPLFFLLNGYASLYSAIAYKNILEGVFKSSGGNVEFGELAIEESSGARVLPAGIFSRWSNEERKTT